MQSLRGQVFVRKRRGRGVKLKGRGGVLKGRREEEIRVELDCMAACNSPGGQAGQVRWARGSQVVRWVIDQVVMLVIE